MIDIEKILSKAERDYLLSGGDQFVLPLRHKSEFFSNLKSFEDFLGRYPFLKITGYRNVKEGNVRIGRPSEVTVSLKDLLEQRPELSVIKKDWDNAIKSCRLMNLEGFIKKNFSDCKKKSSSLLVYSEILEYLVKNKNEIRGLYPRQISHGQSTKIIGKDSLFLKLYYFYVYEVNGAKEENISWKSFYNELNLKSKPLSFKFYADKIQFDGITLSSIHSILNAEDMHRWSLEDFENILIVENEESFYPLHGMLTKTLTILGSGKMAASLGFLAKANFNAKIYYWGDIDKEGLDILYFIHSLFPSVTPLCMDFKTIKKYEHLKQKVSPQISLRKSAPLLAEEYKFICEQGIQLEQEQLPLNEVLGLIN